MFKKCVLLVLVCLTVVCESDEQKKALMQKLGVPAWEAFVNGKSLAGLLDVLVST